MQSIIVRTKIRQRHHSINNSKSSATRAIARKDIEMAWQLLRICETASVQLPPLLVSATFVDDSSYTIYLTDLTHIWRESLSRRAIIRRSQEEATSIDPSDDGRQMHIILEKIRLGLDGGKGTTSALTINPDDDRPTITLHLTVKLPGGLPPLEWPIRLSAAPQTLLASHLIAPLLGTQHIRLQETSSLAEVLREKDHVIEKLIDKLESQGTELGDIFPQIAGKAGRRIDRNKAGERVRGLGPFVLGSWRAQAKTHIPSDLSDLLALVFKRGDGEGIDAGTGGIEIGQDSWWEDIQGMTVNLDTGKITTRSGKSQPQKQKSLVKQFPPKPSTKAKLDSQSESEDNGDFQKQSTPPRTTSVVASKPKVHDSTDSEDDDLDAPSQVSKIPDSYPLSQAAVAPSQLSKDSQKLGDMGGSKKKNVKAADEDDGVVSVDETPASPKAKKKFGAVGGKKPPLKNLDDSSTEDDDPTEDSPTTTRPRAVSSDTDSVVSFIHVTVPRRAIKASRQRQDINSSPPKADSPEPLPEPKKRGLGRIRGKKPPPIPSPSPPPEEEPSPPPAKRKGKLGQIGGKKKAVAEDNTPEASDAESAISKKKKLGAIGGRKRIASSPLAPDLEPADEENVAVRGRGRTTMKKEKEKTPEVRETSQERADKKRAALKRELEAKAKAAPVKKKRKF